MSGFKNMKHREIIFEISVLVVGACLAPFLAHAAATLYFSAPTGTVEAGTPFAVHALIDTDQPMNAFDLMIHLDGPISLLQTGNAHSIISIWQTNPSAKNGEIEIVGGSVPAFMGKGGELITFYAVGTATGTATFSFENSAAYLADGKGTKFIPATEATTVAIVGNPHGAEASSTVSFASQPATVPDIVSLAIITRPSGQKLLSFFATDSGSGIQGTFVRYRMFASWSPWQPALNPMPLPGRVWAVDFRAVNNAGVVREQVIYDWGAVWIGVIWICFAVAVVFAVAWFMRRRHVSRHS